MLSSIYITIPIGHLPLITGKTVGKEAVYLKRYQGLWRGVICITVALLVGLLYTRFIYSNLLELLITILVELGTEAGAVAYEQGYILH